MSGKRTQVQIQSRPSKVVTEAGFSPPSSLEKNTKVPYVPRTFLGKLLFYPFSQFYVRDYDSYDRRMNVIVLLLFEFMCIQIGLSGCAMSLYEWYLGTLGPEHGWPAVLWAYLTIMNLFTIRKMFEIHLFISTALQYMVVWGMYLLWGGSMLDINLFPFIIGMSFFSIVLSNKRLVRLFWIASSILSIIIQIVLNIFYSQDVFDTMNFREISPIIYISNRYLYMFTPVLGELLGYMYFSGRVEKERKYITKIAECISKLEIRNVVLIKLKGKAEKYCSDIERMFKGILSNLEEYVNYLPENLKEKNYREENFNFSDETIMSNEDSDIQMQSYGNKSDSSHSISTIDTPNQSNDTRDSSISSHRNNTYTSQITRVSEKNEFTQVGLVAKNVSYMVIFIPKIFQRLQSESQSLEGEGGGEKSHIEDEDGELLRNYHNFIKQVYFQVRKNKGIVDEIYNDYIVATWNNLKICISHVEKACAAACDITKACDSKKFQFPYKMRIIISTGEVYCGNVGGKLFKRYVKISPIIPLAHRLKHVNVIDMGEPDIIVTKAVHEAVRYISYTKIINVIKIGNKIEKVYRLIDMKKINAKEEWMYQISSDVGGGISESDKEQKTRSEGWEKVWDDITNHNWKVAEMLVRENFRSDPDSDHVLDSIQERRDFIDLN